MSGKKYDYKRQLREYRKQYNASQDDPETDAVEEKVNADPYASRRPVGPQTDSPFRVRK